MGLYIIHPLWAPHLTDVEEAWDRGAESALSRAPTLFPTLNFTGSTPVSHSPVLELVLPSPAGKNTLLTARGGNFWWTLPIHASSRAIVRNPVVAEWHEDMPSVSVKPREASTCTDYLYTILPHDRKMWLPHLHVIAVDAVERFRGILGYFTLEQSPLIEEGIFEDIGEPVPWPSTIYSFCGRTF